MRRIRHMSYQWCDINVLLIFLFLLDITIVLLRASFWATLRLCFANILNSYILNRPFTYHILLIGCYVGITATRFCLRIVNIDFNFCFWIFHSIQLRLQDCFRLLSLLALISSRIGLDFIRRLNERKFLLAILSIDSLAFAIPSIFSFIKVILLQLMFEIMQ